MTLNVKSFFDTDTSTFTHLVIDQYTKKCAVIDSVLNFNQYTACFNTHHADNIIDYIKRHDLHNEWILETHIHADHISAAFYLKNHIGGQIAIGAGIKEVLAVWVLKLDTQEDTPLDASQFDMVFDDGDVFKIGNLSVTVWHTSGHTPSCVSYLVHDAIFVGDTILAPHIGTARCDFPGGDAKKMYQTIQRIYSLPDDTRIFLCHDYPQQGFEPLAMTTVGYQKNHNIQIKHTTNMNDYIALRTQRDETLSIPKLLYPAIQANMRLGSFGNPHKNGLQYLKIPVNAL
jgi:glyoxylase-like metal-dependent hydrolase (beta-lactamase superfamily II)